MAGPWLWRGYARTAITISKKRRLRALVAVVALISAISYWLDMDALDVLEDGNARRTQELTAAVPELGKEITPGSGKCATRSPLSSRLLFVLAMEGRLVRARPAGTWRSSQYHWSALSGSSART